MMNGTHHVESQCDRQLESVVGTPVLGDRAVQSHVEHAESGVSSRLHVQDFTQHRLLSYLKHRFEVYIVIKQIKKHAILSTKRYFKPFNVQGRYW